MAKSLFIITMILIVLANVGICQSPLLKQLSIMPIPYTTKQQDIRTILDKDSNYRVAIVKLSEALVQKGFTTLDFIAKLRKANDDQHFKSLDNTQKAKANLIERAAPDIYIETEIRHIENIKVDRVRLILNAYHTATGLSIGNTTYLTNQFRDVTVDQLTERAIRQCIDEFLKSLELGFNDFIKNGQPLQLHFEIDETSELEMYSEFQDTTSVKEILPLKRLIPRWFENNEWIKSFRIRGAGKKSLIVDELRIPFLINDRYFPPTKVLDAIYFFLKKLSHPNIKLKIEDDQIGNTYYFRILEM